MLTEIVLTRIELDLKEALQELAEERGTTIAQIIRQSCIEHLQRSGIILKKKSKKERG